MCRLTEAAVAASALPVCPDALNPRGLGEDPPFQKSAAFLSKLLLTNGRESPPTEGFNCSYNKCVTFPGPSSPRDTRRRLSLRGFSCRHSLIHFQRR